jgi:hypothetical protein
LPTLLKDLFITIDIDWAPDAAIEMTAAILEEAGCCATWFATHATPALEGLRARRDLFELGIHPNFLEGSSHGSEPDEVLKNVLAIVPEARCVRSHSMFMSGPILAAIRRFPQLKLDCSLMLPGLQQATAVAYGEGETTLWLLPSYWCDDDEASLSKPNWELDQRFEAPGVKVLIFHPIHVAMNSARIEDYAALKASRGHVTDWSRELLDSARHDGPGSRTLLERAAGELARRDAGATLGSLIPEPARNG